MSSPDELLPALYRRSDLDAIIPSGPALRRAIRRGDLIRVRHGVYAQANEWNLLDADARYRAFIHAAALELSPSTVFSHESAAAIWGLPIVGARPSAVHTLVPRAGGGRSDEGVRRHALGADVAGTTVHQQLSLTTIERTVIDLAASASLFSAIAAADRAIHVARFNPNPLTTREKLVVEWERLLPFYGSARALKILNFADERSGSTSESTSRTTIALLGFPRPILQREYRIASGLVPVDFYFEEVDAIGECDGEDKYTNPLLRGGRTVEEVVLLEKHRENELRRQARGFARWNSREAMSPRLLRPKLLELGLRQSAPRLRGR